MECGLKPHIVWVFLYAEMKYHIIIIWILQKQHITDKQQLYIVLLTTRTVMYDHPYIVLLTTRTVMYDHPYIVLFIAMAFIDHDYVVFLCSWLLLTTFGMSIFSFICDHSTLT